MIQTLIALLCFSAFAANEHYDADPSFHPKASAPAFTKKHPAVCFDRGHHNLWNDEEGFGRYKPVLGLIESDGFRIIQERRKYDAKTLSGCDVLYVSAAMGHDDIAQKKLAARSAFTTAEISAIRKWVESRGALLLMTDHRPMSDAVASLLGAFGVHGSPVNVRNPLKPIPPFKEAGIFEMTGDQLDPSNPIIKGRNESERVKRVFFFYGQSLACKTHCEYFLKTGAGSLIGGENDDPVVDPKLYPAAAVALRQGKGRFVAMGDATILTSKIEKTSSQKTGINREGSDNVQLALNLFRWLAGAGE